MRTHLTEFGKVYLERLRIVFKTERDHRIQDVLATDRLALLELALLRRLRRDKTDEFRHALLHALLGVLRYLCCWRHRVLHDTRHICNLGVRAAGTGIEAVAVAVVTKVGTGALRRSRWVGARRLTGR